MGVERTILTAKKRVLDSSGLAVVAGMESCFPSACFSRESPDGSKSSDPAEPHLARLCGLHSEGLSHDGAATSNGLQIGHAATTGRGLAGRGREGAKRGRRGLLQEWAHGLRLAKYGVHGGRAGGLDRTAVGGMDFWRYIRRGEVVVWSERRNGRWQFYVVDAFLGSMGTPAVDYRHLLGLWSPKHNFQLAVCDWSILGLNKLTFPLRGTSPVD
jgi:hypothetical protein